MDDETLDQVADAYDHRCAIGGACRGPLVYHHIKPKARGGSNAAANLCLLCEKHHAMVHEGAYPGWLLDSSDEEPDEVPWDPRRRSCQRTS